ncbi:hypothetical protein ASPCAL10260 [Aspergillus calidoustus]|uniref:Uncharacterized protein n=1 Tax=Aspergillus calidoustus TaxID=454130 RepID=A0A0U5G9M8_ASPCI|nr:hypothetical protein ASPCAL10260 [Aspergillus calidoustus]
MSGSHIAPQLGLQPPTIRDHAIQIEADIRALMEYRVNPLGKNRAPNWNMIEPLLRSFNTYLEKTQDLPTTSQLATEVHATARAQEILSKEITEIKNILAAPVDPTLEWTPRDPREAERNESGANKPSSNRRRRKRKGQQHAKKSPGSSPTENPDYRSETTSQR